jgi:orotidine-5'-phosphate decarboxylase
MTRAEIFHQIKKKKSFLCIGLDTDLEKIPKHLLNTDDPVFEFNKQIIDATKDFCVAYKPNIAFYECLGIKGWQSLEKTLNYIPKDIFTIADAKRGDIGNTSKMYAKTFFEQYNFDSITVAPYMGEDSVTPFLEYKNKWVILLALTSNNGADNFQKSQIRNQKSEVRPLFEEVLLTSQKWGTAENMMYVIGATQSEMFKQVRKIVPDHFLLVPGVGAQGGDLQEVSKNGMNKDCGLLVNVSRNIIYATNGEDFAEKAKKESQKIQMEMDQLLNKLL